MNLRVRAVAVLLVASCSSLPFTRSTATRQGAKLPPGSLLQTAQDPRAEAAARFMAGRLAEMAASAPDVGANREELLGEATLQYERVLVLDPQAEDVHRHLLDVYAARGDADRSLQHARTLLALHPNDPELLDKAGRLLEWMAQRSRQEKDNAGALRAWREKLDLMPGDAAALEGMIGLQSDAGDESGLISTLEERVRFHPESLVARFELGYAYFELKRFPEAVRELEPVLAGAAKDPKLKPLDGRIRFVLGRARAETGATAAALTVLHGVSPGDPMFEEVRAEEARLLGEAGRTDEAIRSLRQAVKGRPFSPLHVALAQMLQKAGRLNQAVAMLQETIRADEENAGRARLALAGVLREADQIDQAAAVLREVDRGEPGYFEARLNLIRMLEGEGRTPAAVKELQQLADEQPDTLQLQLYLAELVRRSGDPVRAKGILEKAVANAEGSSDVDRARYTLGRFYQESGDTERALDVLGQIEAGTEVHAEARLALAQIYEDRDDFPRAIKEVQGVISERPDAFDLQIYLAGLLQRSGDTAGAVSHLEELQSAKGVDQGRIHYALGRLYSDAGRAAEAEKMLKAVPRNDAVYADAQIALVQLFEDQKRPEDALRSLRDAIAARPDMLDLKIYLAEVTQRTGDLPQAVQIMEGLIKSNPKRKEDLQYRLGVIYGSAGQEDRAVQIMLKVLDGDGRDDARVLNYVGYTWADRGVRLREAEKMIRRALELEPDDGAIADSMGWVLYKQGLEQRGGGNEQKARNSLEAALVQLERASKLEPRDPTITRHLGDVYRSLARHDDALKTYRKVLELDPEDADEQEVRRQIELLEAEKRGAR